MGCVFGKENLAASEARERNGKREKEKKDDLEGVESGRKTDLPVMDAGKDGENGVVELSDDGKEKEKQKGEGDDGEEDWDGEGKVGRNQRQRGERRRSKPNPRLSNPPKHVQGEQVAAGWPSWLSAVAGEAINGWVPRRADTFQKIDKVGFRIFFGLLVSFTSSF